MFDLCIVGGGINGAGIARDAAGRGLSTLLIERADLASATSQWSTKLIHGGLRYLEHYEFRLVGESLAEREVLLRAAPHLIEPLAFVLPHEPHLRPAWMIRAGLLLYDRIGGRTSLPRSFATKLEPARFGAGLKARFRRGFVYSDARVDDARLVIATAISAREKGATIRTRTSFEHASREGDHWRIKLIDVHGKRSEVEARILVNAAGPWVGDVLGHVPSAPTKARVRHVQGSHIIVPSVHTQEHAYILQNADKRIVFIIPYQGRYSLIGTTDVAVSNYERPAISDAETDYLIALANAYLDKPLSRSDIVWSYSGVRPLYDDGESDPSSITRDYVLKVDAGNDGNAPPVLSIYGGKLTTYRKLAEAVLDELRPFIPGMRESWTAGQALPGGDLPAPSREQWISELKRRYPKLPAVLVANVAKRHGSRAPAVLGDASTVQDLGVDFGNGLTEREIDYLVEHEWARSADDVLWRRTKAGLGMSDTQRAAVVEHLEATA
ncbi:MAG TPA: glycerol-3-phosphate dehydrogenase [Casimicrobiaceae bacterium]|nr:glycerol-3-phosphate dehydrogenase [Casimicrobiaceae bacterium]